MNPRATVDIFSSMVREYSSSRVNVCRSILMETTVFIPPVDAALALITTPFPFYSMQM